MKKMLRSLLTMSTLITITLSSCSDDDSVQQPVDPSDVNALSSVLIIPGNKRSGDLPVSSNDPNAPNIGNNQTSASVVADNTLFLPFNFFTASGAGSGYGGCYIQVDGASDFWDIPASSITTDDIGLLVIPVQIPDFILNGDFSLSYAIYDNNNRVSNMLTTSVVIESIQTCPGTDSGSDGLTILSYDLGDSSGIVPIRYNMYSLRDRMDVFYNDQWVGGTGSSLGVNDFPPVSQCGDGTDGYVSGSGTVELNYDPGISRILTLYMSGCIGSSTAWDLRVGCPD
ncbi:hypothetical protein FNH22_30750 [Fulvivirga sp. M361]|uniref:hypothetical protein n=1 Tax=Fulvivirga sp. M361 TaxID=2594266 RepID=UPI001179BB3E|nr:hypothetical protein [Fulvivirga sp. M361]TRX46490.1 hypothetical protein FNH22_30750 [Fulvivirga sp. M361]